jgi:PAS domain S-box-containing protein
MHWATAISRLFQKLFGISLSRESFPDSRQHFLATVATNTLPFYCAAFLVYAFIYLSLGCYCSMSGTVVGLVAVLISYGIIRQRRNFALAAFVANLGALAALATISISLLSAGDCYLTVLFWLIPLVVSSYLQTGSRHGNIIAVCAFLLILGIAAAKFVPVATAGFRGDPFPAEGALYASFNLLNLFGAIANSALLAALVSHNHRGVIRDSDEIREKLQRGHEKLQLQASQQAALAEFGRTALLESNVDILFQQAVALVSKMLRTKFAEVLEHRPDHGSLFLRAGVGWEDGWVGHKSVPDGVGSQGGYTLLQKKPVLVEDIHSETRFSPPSLLTEHDVVGGVTVAIPGPEMPFGILGVHTDRLQLFGADDAFFLEAMANILAAAVQRTRTLEEIQRAEMKFRTLYDSTSDGVLLLDETGLFDCNAAALRIFGCSEKRDLLAKHPADLSPTHQPCGNESLKLANERIAMAFAKGCDRFEWLHRRMDNGKEFPAELLFNSLTLDGRDVLQVTVRDISDRKDTEQQLARSRQKLANTVKELEAFNKALAESSEKAEAATRAKSEFLANMSHEIRTPMTAILGFSEVLMGDELSQEQLDAVTTIKRNGEYLIGIINDILDLSKIEAGKLETERIQCSPFQILSDVASLMLARANAKGLLLNVQYDGLIPQRIYSDPTRLRQILINLVGNAIKFTETGEICLVTRLLDAELNEPRLQIDVVDSGIGMTEQQAARLFQPFHQADSSTTRKFGGTGLGLTISKRLADKLGGDITVTSDLGRGSTFTVTIATGSLEGVVLVENAGGVGIPTHPQVRKQADGPQRLDCRLLLAEDGPDNQRLFAFVLKKAGAEVTVAENGQMAYDQALAAREQGTPFDVILMDMQMPVMDGYTSTSKLRDAGYSGPIIALTAHAMSTDREKCLRAGCDDYMTKPIDRRKLISMIARWTSDKRRTAVDRA